MGPIGWGRLVGDGEELPPGDGGQQAVVRVVGRRGEDPAGGAEGGDRGGREGGEWGHAGQEDGEGECFYAVMLRATNSVYPPRLLNVEKVNWLLDLVGHTISGSTHKKIKQCLSLCISQIIVYRV